jgi:replicative DNA helicase
VLFIHRPEYYGMTEDENGNSTQGLAEIIIAKHRNGATGDIRLRFLSDQAKFTDENVSDEERQQYDPPSPNTYPSKMNNGYKSKMETSKEFEIQDTQPF